jgi:hypothetical protein
MAELQKPARVGSAADDSDIKGAHLDDVVHGSRLKRAIEASGGTVDDGEPKKKDGKELVSDSRFFKIMQGKRAMLRFLWPGTDEWCGIVVLTTEELEEAHIAACQRLEEAATTLDRDSYIERLAYEANVQIVWRCLVDPETHRPWALTPDEMRQATADVLDYCIRKYDDWQKQISPLSSPEITEADAKQIVEDLKKEPEAVPLGSYGAASLRLLIKHLVAQESEAKS